MSERPMLFSGPMVRAILDGRKTQTRRVVKPQPVASQEWAGGAYFERRVASITQSTPERWGLPLIMQFCPYGQPGDRLWVRESCRGEELTSGTDGVRYRADDAFVPIQNTFAASENWLRLHTYRGHAESVEGVWVPSIHMPRWASRITLEITGVRVERLQDISEEDAQAEGALLAAETTESDERLRIECGYYPPSSYAHGFRLLWESINGEGSWAANPWVWVVEFRRLA